MNNKDRIYTFDICSQCQSRDFGQIDITLPNLIFIPSCGRDKWSMEGKRSGGVWGPTKNCDMHLEQVVAGRKKFIITSVKDLDKINKEINTGNAIMSFKPNLKEFTIFFSQKSLFESDKTYLIDIYRRHFININEIPKTAEKLMPFQQYEYFHSVKEFKKQKTSFLLDLEQKDIVTLIMHETEKNIDFLKSIIKLKYPFTQEKFNKWYKKKEKENVIS